MIASDWKPDQALERDKISEGAIAEAVVEASDKAVMEYLDRTKMEPKARGQFLMDVAEDVAFAIVHGHTAYHAAIAEQEEGGDVG